MNENRKTGNIGQKILAAAAVGLFAAVSWILFRYAGKPILDLVSSPERFREWVDSTGFAGRLAYLGMVILQIFVAVIPGEPLELAAGYAFGAVEGTLLCLLGAFLGSVLVFAFVRCCGVRVLRVFFPKEKIDSLRFLKTSPKRSLLLFVLILIPGTPKDLLCYFAGLTDLSWKRWLLICSVGRIPSILTSTVGGDALGSGSYLFAGIVLLVTAALSLAGLLAYRRICQKQEEQINGPHSDPVP